MTQTDKQAQCSEAVLDSTGWHRYPCSRKAKVEHEGKGYCTQHDPERVARKRGEQQARWRAEEDARQQGIRRIIAEGRACDGISTEALEAGVVADLLAALQAIVDKARGGANSGAFINCGYTLEGALHEIVIGAKAAIAKAKGG